MAGRKVQYVKQETPSFIKNFKEKHGYKEPDNIDSKFKELEKSSNEDDEDREGEKPVVVLGSNVTEEEANEFLAKQREEDGEENQVTTEIKTDEKEKPNAGNHGDKKFVFKKPTKRKSEETRRDDRKKHKEKSKSSGSSKAVKNTSLLSFGCEEDEEG